MISEDMQGNPLPTPQGQEQLEARILAVIVEQATDKPYGAVLKLRVDSRRNVRRQLSGSEFFLEFDVDPQYSLPSDLANPLYEEALIGRKEDEFYGGSIYFWSEKNRSLDMLEGYGHFGDYPADLSHLRVADWTGERVQP